MKYFLISFLLLVTVTIKAQTYTAEQYYSYYKSSQQQWQGADYAGFLDSVNFYGVSFLKNYNRHTMKTILLGFGEPEIRQMNIDGCYFCATKHEEMYQLWNLWYPYVNRERFDVWCKAFVAMMVIDGILKDR